MVICEYYTIIPTSSLKLHEEVVERKDAKQTRDWVYDPTQCSVGHKQK